MGNPVKLVVFDIAGTTVKDNGEIAIAFQQAVKQYGYDIPVEKINPLMGYKKTEAIKLLLEEFEADAQKITEHFINEVHDLFIKLMVKHYQSQQIELLPNVEHVFNQLKQQQIKIGVDTGFPNNITDVIIERLGWLKDSVIDYVVSSNEVPAGRPQPFMIQKMMQQAGITDAAEVIKIGDTEVDVNEGKNAGCLYSIAVTTGAFTREQLEPYRPSFIFDDLNELLPLLNAN